MCPAQGVVCAYAGPVRPDRAPTGGARSPRARRAPGGSTPTVLPRQHACPAGLPAGAPRSRCGLTCCFAQTLHRDWTTRRGVRAPREPTLPVLLSCAAVRRRLGGVRRPRDRVGLATLAAWGCAGRPPAPRARPRARAHSAPRPARAGRDRSGGPLAPQDAGRASPVVGHAASARLDRPGTGSWWDRAVDRHRPEAQEPCAGRVPGRPHRPRPPPTRVGAPAAAGLGSPWAGGWRPAPAQARVARTPRASHPARLHPPDGQRGPLGAAAIPRRLRAWCWGSALPLAASTAPRRARPVATGGFAVSDGPGRTASGAAPRGSAASSLTVRPAARPLTAPTPVRTGPGPRARRTPPSPGSTTTHGCGGRSRTSGCPGRVRRHSARWSAATSRPSPPAACRAPPRPSRHGRGSHGASAAESGGSGCSRRGPALDATLRTGLPSWPAGDSRPRAPGCLHATTSWSMAPPGR